MSDSKQTATADRADPILAHPTAYTIALCLLWIIPGLFGHDPWKPDEAEVFGVVYHVVQTGDWVVPTLAHEPFLETPPFFHVTAALVAQTLHGMLALHDAARLTSGLYMVLTFLLVALTARELLGPNRGWLAALALLGSLGLLVPAHLLLTDVAQLTGAALALYGLALSLRRPVLGGIWLGTGVGLGFMSNGLLIFVSVLIAALLLPIIAPAWRTRRYSATLAVACVAALPWLLIWPIALYLRSAALFHEWWWVNNLGHYLGEGGPSMPEKPGYYLRTLPWFAFPTLALAAWAPWVERQRLRQDPALILPLLVSLVMLVVLSLATSPSEVYALPLLPPLAILAVQGLFRLRRSGINAFWWFAILFGSFMVLMAWFEWTALELGFPAARQRHWLKLQPGYTPGFELFTLLFGLAVSAFWIWVVTRLRRTPERPMVAWASGVWVVWALAVTMFTGYLEAGRSYRPLAGQISSALPQRYNCIASHNLGDSQRALLQYFAGIVTHRAEAQSRRRDCEVLLVQGVRSSMRQPGPGWALLWEGGRSGDRKELFRLYRRV